LYYARAAEVHEARIGELRSRSVARGNSFIGKKDKDIIKLLDDASKESRQYKRFSGDRYSSPRRSAGGWPQKE
jgi:hypothetical protein